MSKTTITRGNIAKFSVISAPITPAAVSSTEATQTFSINDLFLNDAVSISYPGAQTAGVSVANAWVSASNVLSVQFANASGSSATPASGNYLITIARCEDQPLPASSV
jgi:hypothetical protein